MEFKDFMEFIKSLFLQDWKSVVIEILIFLFFWSAFFNDGFKKFWAWIFIPFAGISNFSRKKYISSKLVPRLNLGIKHLSKEKINVLTERFKIKWQKKVNPENFIKENVAIIKLNYDPNIDKNLINLLLGYSNTCILNNSRVYMPDVLSDGIDYLITKKILNDQDNNTLQFFINNYLIPQMDLNEDFTSAFKNLERIDNGGLLSHICIFELERLSHSIYPQKIGEGNIKNEIFDFTNYLSSIASKRPGDDVQLEFHKQYIRTNIILVAKLQNRIKGIAKYLYTARRCLQKNPETIYLLAKDINIGFAERASKNIEAKLNLKSDLVEYFKIKEENKTRKVYCVRYVI